MKRSHKITISIAGAIAIIVIIMHIPIWIDDYTARKNKETVIKLIKTGDNISQAQQTLIENGFDLLYPDPITPTYNKDYYQQLVIT